MAMFGFVYLWYLMVVLVLEIWLDYRARYRLISSVQHGVDARDLPGADAGLHEHQSSVRLRDRRQVGCAVTVIGIPSAFMLHGYVGFIFGSVKANPWWSTPLMPIVFLFSAMVSGIALVMLLYMLMMWARRQTHRHALRRHHCEVSVLHFPHRFRARRCST